MESFEVPGFLYKYRSLEDLERLFSIIIDKKLYGALYKELNDPMEGYYLYDASVDKDSVRPILESKQKTYICSLSKRGDIGLMWTHYADENRGCCLEVEVTSKTWRPVEVTYEEKMPPLLPGTTIDEILGTKAKMWEYEQEVRYLSPEVDPNKKRPRLAVRINRILVGCNVKREKFTHLKKIVEALAKDSKIEVKKMSKSDLDYGYKK